MRMIISFAALFLSAALLQFSSGGVGPLDALTGLSIGFSKSQVGFLGSAHFLGFFIGCWWAPRLMGNVGHSRAFAVFTAMGAIGMAAHVVVSDPNWWALFRIASGVCVAGCYTVIEAWLQAKVTNETRGRAMGTYRIVDMGASLIAQFMIGALANLETYIAYNLLTILCCASLLPLALTKVPQPDTPKATRLRPMMAWRASPLAVAGVIVAALSSASFRMVGPIYGQDVGLAPQQIGYFLAAFVAGGALAQYPMGWLADKYDRRWVLIMLTSALFGLTTFPIYSVAASHAHDFASNDQRVELSAALMFFYAVGAIAAPYTASALIAAYGPPAFFILMADLRTTHQFHDWQAFGTLPQPLTSFICIHAALEQRGTDRTNPMARHLITSAIPYINGIKHLGNLVGSQLPADLYARYLRQRGHEVLFLCATDEHGTPAELAAAKAGKPVADYCAEMHDVQAEIANGFGLSFDHFGRSSSPQNHKLTQAFAGRLHEMGLIREVTEEMVYSIADGRFLPDRYIEGTCPNCGFDSARGDQCDNCTKQLDPTDLIDAHSTISGSKDLEVRRHHPRP